MVVRLRDLPGGWDLVRVAEEATRHLKKQVQIFVDEMYLYEIADGVETDVTALQSIGVYTEVVEEKLHTT